MKDPRSLSNEALARAKARADATLGYHVDRFYTHDEAFKNALNWALAVDEEIERRRPPPD
jgi:hypothetical protein